MDRKGIIAISLSLITLVAWFFYTNNENRKAVATYAREQAATEAAKAEAAKTEPLPEKPGSTPRRPPRPGPGR